MFFHHNSKLEMKMRHLMQKNKIKYLSINLSIIGEEKIMAHHFQPSYILSNYAVSYMIFFKSKKKFILIK